MGILDAADPLRGPRSCNSECAQAGLVRSARSLAYLTLDSVRVLRLGLYAVGLWLTGAPAKSPVRVYYGHQRIPSLIEPSVGGIVKFQRMQASFPNSPWRFNVLYLVSSRLPHVPVGLMRAARARGARVVWNQNGVAYEGWYGAGWERINAPMTAILTEADHVFYQSRFCKISADCFIGQPTSSHEILYNPVDTKAFAPPSAPLEEKPLTLLIAGTQDIFYKLSVPLQALALIASERPDVRMIVAGRLRWVPDEAECERVADRLAAELGVTDRVEFLGPYVQADAPQLFQRAHVLIHAKYNDPCPTVVLEAMACGVPVVYSASGGVPELVGPDAGIGIPAELSWERQIPPDPKAVARAVLEIAERRDRFVEAARQRAVDRFDVKPWLTRHREVFEELLH